MTRVADLFLTRFQTLNLPQHLTSWVAGKTPISTDLSIFTVIASYLTVIYGMKAIMENRQPYRMTRLFQAHNLLSSAFSLLLLVLMLEEIGPMIWQRGFFYSLCAEEALTPVSSVHLTASIY
jgi:fatty acid elongase 3